MPQRNVIVIKTYYKNQWLIVHTQRKLSEDFSLSLDLTDPSFFVLMYAKEKEESIR
ncbi:hypothetical protein WN55_02484 [Dufourea novaeangliae]|uniref:Uncharacterized protein n=1 Tax=Dufourea novaeangliae TaxID=178035 RepID=A0A154PGZ9_DUFNO|nr:hypothetical protein WN55_02484 [Dufourea novaeangliae]